MELTGEYKGFKIRVEDWDDGKTVVAIIVSGIYGRSVIKDVSLPQIKKKIDRVIKNNFKRFDAYLETMWGDTYKKVTVTSITEGEEFWFIDENKQRGKTRTLFKASPENENIMEKIEDNRVLRKGLAREKEVLCSALEEVTV